MSVDDTIVATAALGIAFMLCVFAWVAAKRWAAILLPVCVVMACFCIFLPLGKPIPFAPKPGKYTVLGADIQVGIAIFVLLKQGDMEPVYVKLPYSTSAANSLQQALDGAENGQGVQATVDGEGGASFDGPPPVTGDQSKVPETPAISLP